MSVEFPKVAIAFGSYGIPQGDVINCRVYLGCTKEVSSFEVLLQNWNGKYSPGGSVPLNVGMDGGISIGRGANVPQIITCRIESIKYESTPTENYVRVSGRCWGERLFRRVVTKTYENKKGEEIVKDLLDNYVGLSHNRGGTELVEATDTTYTRLEYENTPVFDIIRYIAESADKQGVIGYDFRVAPDGKFEFFPRLSKTSAISLSEKIEESEYRKDIHRIRNRVYIYGANEKKSPTDNNEDGLTESLDYWTSNGSLSLDGNHVTEDGQTKYADSYSICATNTGGNEIWAHRSLTPIKFNGQDGFKQIRFWFMWTRYESGTPSAAKIRLYTNENNYFEADILALLGSQAQWQKITLRTDQPTWTAIGSPSWNSINGIRFIMTHPIACIPVIRVDHLLFSDCRYAAMQEDVNSQNTYGLRELTETDEELKSDNECLLRAKALLAYLKDPAEYLTLKSTIIDYGNTPPLPGDKIHVTLPNENLDADFRILSVEYYVDAKTQTLEICLELGRETPLLADYLYALRSKTESLSRYKATRLV
ncbi:MAG: hypothetical protein QXW17_01560 [Candidatus Bathyarchaeia archaeon]